MRIAIGACGAVKVFDERILSRAEVAAGRVGLFFLPSTKLKDMVAGVCVVRASGEKVVDYEGRDGAYIPKGSLQAMPG